MIDFGNISINNLVVFRKIIETGSVTEAANQLGKTQPTISAALKQLRSYFGDGILLVDEYGRYVPSQHGMRVYLAINNLFEHIAPENASIKNTTTNHYRLLVTDYFATLYLTSLLEYFKQINIEVKVSVISSKEKFFKTISDNKEQYDIYVGSDENIVGYNNQQLDHDQRIVIANIDMPIDSLSLDQYLCARHVSLTESEPPFFTDIVAQSVKRKKVITCNHTLSLLHYISQMPDVLMTTTQKTYDKFRQLYPIKALLTDFKLPKKVIFINYLNKAHNNAFVNWFMLWWEQSKRESAN
ncbi:MULTISPECIES: LysR family transcriptional regulator [Cysteiniphilum]|uniref:LysR family transcriptional regulator n=1 Tax=Cysteiniphilum litorale TaxID=2056700 RepID=A0A8J2Z498_9GAMM|nr:MULTISPECIES: LysR family transcriptional regulator [Cysteiniphilum]GGF97860.1 LysR family transcriptional regulator [Cysteiniphilum litorale]